MGLLGLLGRIGHGITNGIDNAALNSLGGGLLGSALAPAMPTGGLLAQQQPQYDPNQSQNNDDNPAQPAPMQQMQQPGKFVPTPDQRRNMRSQFLLNIGAALQQGRPIGEGIQNYQANAIGQLQANQAATLARNKQQALSGFQQEMQQAGGNLQMQQQILTKYAPLLGPQETKAYADLFKGMQPEKDDIVGDAFAATLNGTPGMFLKTKTGRIIPTGMQPQRTLATDGQGNIYDVHAGGDPIVRAGDKKPEPETRYQNVSTPQGIYRVPETGAANPQPLIGPDGKPLMPMKTASGAPVVNIAAPLPDGSANPMVQSIANYDTNLVTPRGGSPAAMKIYQDTIAAVKKMNPSWDMKNYQAAQHTLTAFNSGKEASSVNAINTVAGHLDSLANAASALNGGDITALNRIANAWGLQTGSQPLAVYNTIVHRIGPEITKAYVGTGGEAADRKANESDFDASLGAPRIMANIGATANLFQSKMNALGHQFEQGIPGRKFEGYITPEAQATFSRFAPQPQQGNRPPLASFFTGGR